MGSLDVLELMVPMSECACVRLGPVKELPASKDEYAVVLGNNGVPLGIVERRTLLALEKRRQPLRGDSPHVRSKTDELYLSDGRSPTGAHWTGLMEGCEMPLVWEFLERLEEGGGVLLLYSQQLIAAYRKWPRSSSVKLDSRYNTFFCGDASLAGCTGIVTYVSLNKPHFKSLLHPLFLSVEEKLKNFIRKQTNRPPPDNFAGLIKMIDDKPLKRCLVEGVVGVRLDRFDDEKLDEILEGGRWDPLGRFRNEVMHPAPIVRRPDDVRHVQDMFDRLGALEEWLDKFEEFAHRGPSATRSSATVVPIEDRGDARRR